jgi:hypothetical protein
MSTEVIYDLDQHHATVTIDIQGDTGKTRVPPIALSNGSWTVLWTLPEGYQFGALTLDSHPNWPPELKKHSSHVVDGNPSQWIATFTNKALGANQGEYTVAAVPTNGGKSVCKDPTIVVTKDPIDT